MHAINSLNYLDPDCEDDQSEGLNRLLTDGAGKDIEVLPGVYHLANKSIIKNRTSLHMRGATFKAHADLPANQMLLINEVVAGNSGAYYDTDVRIYDGKFDGGLLPGRTNALLAFLKTNMLLLHRVEICNTSYMGLSIGGSYRPRVEGCDIHHTGNPLITTEGGAGVWFGPTGDGSPCERIELVDNFIHDTEWSGVYATGRIVKAHGNHIYNVKESAFFGVVMGLNYIDNHTKNVNRKYISASGLEIGGRDSIISDSTFESIGNCAVSLTDVNNTTVHDLYCSEIGTEFSRFPQASAVEISSHHPVYSQCNGNSIHNIRLKNSGPLFALITVGGPGKPVSYLRYGPMNGNDNVFTSGSAVYFAPGMKGADVSGV